ncbi:MAG: NAD(P)/FAD-dependent oxidoreductase [Candidatus Sulfobium sp.]
MESYDVVIVGAGPAGLRCAEVLGSTAFSVLLLDRKSAVGSKACAGGLRLPDGYLTLPDSMTSTFERHHFILNGGKYSIHLRNPLHIIDRPDLGRYQLDLIKRHGNITVETGAFVKHIDSNCVVLNKERRIRFTYLVGADGSNSVVRRYLGLANKIYVGIQYIIPGTCDDLVWFFNPHLLGSGYGWVFPHKTFVSAGAAKLEGAPVNCLYRGVKFNNIFLTGDAAGLASACTGEGMVYALTSGDDVARHILDNTYSFEGIKKMIRYKKRQERILYIFDRLPRFQSSLFKVFISLLKLPAFQKYYSGDF